VIVLGSGSVIAAILACGYIPALAAISHLRMAWVPALVGGLGAACSYTAFRNKATGRVGTLCMWMDTLLYTTTFSLAAVLSSEPFSLGFAIALTLFLLYFPARTYALTVPLTIAMCGPPVTITLLLGRDALVSVVVWAACTVALTTAHRTGQKRAHEAERQQLIHALGAAERVADQSMEAALAASLVDIGHFLHELRNARAAQQANLQFVLEEGGLEGELRKALEEAIDAQAEENKLVAAAIERLRRKGRPRSTDFALQDVLREFVRTHRTPLSVTLGIDAPAFVVQGDPEHIKAVLANLVRNAEKAGAANLKILLRANADSKSVSLVVQDDGPGFDSRHLPDLFKPFPELGRPDGTGLGLYLCRRYVDLLGGTIEAVNRPERGAMFRIVLPGQLAKDTCA